MSRPIASTDAIDLLRARLEGVRPGEPLDVAAALDELARLESTVRLLQVVSENGVEQLERGVRELSLLARLGEVFNQPFDLRCAAESLLRLAAEAVPCDNALLYYVYDDPQIDTLAVLGATPTADAFAIAEQVALQSIRDSQTLRIPDVFEDSSFHNTAHRSQMRSFLAAPLRGRDGILGAIVLGETTPEAFPVDQTLILAPIADIAAAALAQVELWETDRVQRERLEERVAERTREVNVVRAALNRQEHNVAMGRLAASIAHEVNNPMSYLVANLRQAIRYSRDVRAALPVLLELLEAVLRVPASPDARVEHVRSIAARAWYATLNEGVAAAASDFNELLREAEEGATRVQRVGEDLRGFAQGIAGVVESVDLNRLVETARHVVESELKGAVFETRTGSLPEVRCQRYEITQVLMTLLQSVVGPEATDDGGESLSVRVTTRRAGAWAEVEIARDEDGLGDSGPGPIDALAGGGLGITIAQDIVDSHDGTIDIQAGGRVLTLRLPIEGPASRPGRRRSAESD